MFQKVVILTERVQLTDDVYVEDAYVDFNLNASNKPELYVLIDDSIGQSTWEPVEADPEEDFWLVENDYGLLSGWQTSLPVSEETGASYTPVEHVELGTVEDRYRALHHVVKKKQNDLEEDSAMAVTLTRGPKGLSSSFAVRTELAQDIVDNYVNGDLGSDTVPYWYWIREHPDGYSWRSGPKEREDYEGYVDADVSLVKDSIYTWYPKRVEQIADEDEIYAEISTKSTEGDTE